MTTAQFIVAAVLCTGLLVLAIGGFIHAMKRDETQEAIDKWRCGGAI